VIFLLDLVPLELQRRIVNDAIGQKAFTMLIWLCGAYAVTALVQGVAKLIWNVYRNSVGEATSRPAAPSALPASSDPRSITVERVLRGVVATENIVT